ncbi:hypothetical protein EXT48_10550 [Pseudoalteromonas sp. CO348]|uniref:hypothetical protein n=1 Tax=Pseudoalteromonas sp. CO348 TaxID=1777271 RepID=UPI001022E804|nr:hypothetical protein [Pseudoalteromonas sp. CO348]RZG04786.1 hypothetical protein EXT48_10550 [Pseudoalteromonas sp. CO348]
MFEALLEDVFKKAGSLKLHLTPEEHNELVGDLVSWLSVEAEPLIGVSQAVLGKDIFKGFDVGFEYSRTPAKEEGLVSVPVNLCTMYIRKEREDRTISLNCDIDRFNMTRNNIDFASVCIELDICGAEGKRVFEELYKNYKRPIVRLLENEKVEFSTSYCSDIVGSYKGKSTQKKLDEYFSDPDVDNCFTLSKNFVEKAGAAELFRVFLLLTALFSSCFGYIGQRKKLDLFELYMKRLSLTFSQRCSAIL